MLKSFNTDNPKSYVLPRCYSYQYMGEEASVNLCTKFYGFKKEKNIKYITCGNENFDEFKFNPDGLFLSKPHDGSFNVDSDKDYKDSFLISHGKCARF